MARKHDNRRRGAKPAARRDAARSAAAVRNPWAIADVRLKKAQLAWQRRRFDDAIRLYEQLLARHPRNPTILVDLARAYALRYRFAEADRLLELTLSLYPDDAIVAQLLGGSFAMTAQFDLAIRHYRRALDLDPGSRDRPMILAEMARMHERLHRLDEARQCAEEALVLEPRLAAARSTLALATRRAGDAAGAEALWRRVVAELAAPAVVADAWYHLAAQADAAGAYDDAFAALTKAKEILTLAAGPQRYDAHDIARIGGRTFAAITPEHFQRWSTAAGELKPLPASLALLTSHPRSGTTLLEQALDSHPAVVSADELQIITDVAYMPLASRGDKDTPIPVAFNRLAVADLEAVRRDYFATMEAALRRPLAGRLLLDKNPELTMLLPLVARAFPEMRVIYALRDPRDVVVSCFTQRLPLNPVSVHYLTLEGTVNKYAATMRAWLKVRDMLRNPWIEVRYEDTVADIEQQARKVLDFLGLPWDDAVLDYRRRAQDKHIHSPTYEAVTRPVYSTSIGRWRNYEAHLAPYLSTLQPFVEAFGYA